MKMFGRLMRGFRANSSVNSPSSAKDKSTNGKKGTHTALSVYKKTGNVNAVSSDGQPLVIEQIKNAKLVEKLWPNNDLNLRVTDKDGNNTLMVAISNGAKRIAELLVTDRRIDHKQTNNKGENALMMAARREDGNSVEMVKILVNSEKFDLKAKNNKGQTASEIAFNANSFEALQIILDKMQSKGQIDHKGKPPRSAYTAYKTTKNVNAVSSDGQPLVLEQIKNPKLIKKLIQHQKTNLSVTDKDGNNVLMLAISNGAMKVAQDLISGGRIDYSQTNNKGENALMMAINSGDSAITTDVVAKLLRSQGFDLEAKNNNGQTVMNIASRPKVFPAIKDLINQHYEGTKLKQRRSSIHNIKGKNNKHDISKHQTVEHFVNGGLDRQGKASSSAKNPTGFTPVSIPAIHKHKQKVRTVINDTLQAFREEPRIKKEKWSGSKVNSSHNKLRGLGDNPQVIQKGYIANSPEGSRGGNEFLNSFEDSTLARSQELRQTSQRLFTRTSHGQQAFRHASASELHQNPLRNNRAQFSASLAVPEPRIIHSGNLNTTKYIPFSASHPVATSTPIGGQYLQRNDKDFFVKDHTVPAVVRGSKSKFRTPTPFPKPSSIDKRMVSAIPKDLMYDDEHFYQSESEMGSLPRGLAVGKDQYYHQPLGHKNTKMPKHGTPMPQKTRQQSVQPPQIVNKPEWVESKALIRPEPRHLRSSSFDPLGPKPPRSPSNKGKQRGHSAPGAFAFTPYSHR